MKLNSTTSMTPFTWDEFSRIHPFAPEDQALGYKEMMDVSTHALEVETGDRESSLPMRVCDHRSSHKT